MPQRWEIARRAKALIRYHPDWGVRRLNRELRSRVGVGLRCRDLLDLKATVLGLPAPNRDVAERRLITSAILSHRPRKRRLRMPVDVVPSPRLASDDERVDKYARSPHRMPYPDMRHRVFVDVEFPRAVETPKGRRRPPRVISEYKTIYVGSYDQSRLARAWRDGEIHRIISSTLNEWGREIGQRLPSPSILGVWVSKHPDVIGEDHARQGCRQSGA